MFPISYRNSSNQSGGHHNGPVLFITSNKKLFFHLKYILFLRRPWRQGQGADFVPFYPPLGWGQWDRVEWVSLGPKWHVSRV